MNPSFIVNANISGTYSADPVLQEKLKKLLIRALEQIDIEIPQEGGRIRVVEVVESK